MNSSTARWFALAIVAGSASFALQAAAPDTNREPAAPSVTEPATPQNTAQQPIEQSNDVGNVADDLAVERDDSDPPAAEHHAEHTHGDRVIVQVGHDAVLAAGEHASAVVAIVGSSSSDGEVSEGVVAVLGSTRMSGSAESVVAIFGDTYVNGNVNDAVAVFGSVELGPHARVRGQVTAVGGTVKRHPQAIVQDSINEVSFPLQLGSANWLRPWLQHCLFYGRPLALEPGIGWAWALAFGFLGLYVLLALLFAGGVEKCVATLEQRPGQSLLAALLTMLLTPVAMVLLVVTVIGIAIIPALWIALFCIGIFGKVVILGALGRRMTRFISAGPLSHVAFPVLLGGLILVAVYLVPVLGMIAYKVTDIIGIGVVVYTMMLSARTYRDATASQVGSPPADAQAVAPVADAADMQFANAAAGVAASTSAPLAAIDAGNLPRAGFWIRMAALLVDVILVAIATASLQADSAWLLCLAAYGAIMWKLRGTTIGGILCRLQVVRVDGRELDWPTCVVRALSCFLSLVVGGLGFLWIVFDNDRQAWHDKIAGTLIVRVPAGRSLV